jgi:hypothetical protein
MRILSLYEANPATKERCTPYLQAIQDFARRTPQSK